MSIYYVNRAKNGSSNANGTGKESMASNNSNNSQTAGNESTSHANNDSVENDNNGSANFHQYGVVAQHRVLDSKQRCGPDVNAKSNGTESSKKSQSTSQSQNHHHHRSGLKSSSGSKLQSPNSNSIGSPQFNNNDLIKVTSFRSANQNKSSNKSANKKYHNEQQSDTLSHSEQSHLLNQNPLAFNAFNQFQPGSPSSSSSSTGNAPNIASALTQFMLAQGISPQQHQLQSLLSGMNPLAQSFNSTTPSPSSSTNSNSSSLSTSPSTSSSSNNNSMYDFNLALKMYQIQLQSMMTANYLQSFNSANNSPQQLAMNGQKKRKHHETTDHNNNNGNESDEDSAYSQPQSPKHNGKVKFNSGANKKMSKNTV